MARVPWASLTSTIWQAARGCSCRQQRSLYQLRSIFLVCQRDMEILSHKDFGNRTPCRMPILTITPLSKVLVWEPSLSVLVLVKLRARVFLLSPAEQPELLGEARCTCRASDMEGAYSRQPYLQGGDLQDGFSCRSFGAALAPSYNRASSIAGSLDKSEESETSSMTVQHS